jgi:hypothetical protein
VLGEGQLGDIILGGDEEETSPVFTSILGTPNTIPGKTFVLGLNIEEDIIGATSYYGHGQAQAWIKTTANAHAQAQADIKQTYNQHGQSQARIKQTYNQHGQAQGIVANTYFVVAQAQAQVTGLGLPV